MTDLKAAASSGPILVEAVAPGVYGRRIAAGEQFHIASIEDFSDADRKVAGDRGASDSDPRLKGWMRKVDPSKPKPAAVALTTDQRLMRLEQSQKALASRNEALEEENARLKAELAKGAGAAGGKAGAAGGKQS